MKLREILTEAPDGTTPGGFKIAKADSAGAANSPVNTDNVSASDSSFASNAAGAAIGAGAAVASKKIGSVASKRSADLKTNLNKKVSDFISRNNIKPSEVTARISKNVGFALRFLKWMGYGQMIVDYYTRAEAYDRLYEIGKQETAAGNQVSAGVTEQEYQYLYRLLREELIVNIGLSLASGPTIRILQKVLLSAAWIPRIFGAAAAPITAGVSIATIVASEAAVIALQQWLMSQQGKEAISWTVANLIDPNIPDKGAALLNKGLKDAQGKTKDENLPAGKPPKPAEPAKLIQNPQAGAGQAALQQLGLD